MGGVRLGNCGSGGSGKEVRRKLVNEGRIGQFAEELGAWGWRGMSPGFVMLFATCMMRHSHG